MIAQLTTTERQIGLVLALIVTLLGAALGLAGRHDVLAYHGLLIAAFGAVVAIAILRQMDRPEPGEERLSEYYDDPIRVGIVLTMVWAIFGMFVGV